MNLLVRGLPDYILRDLEASGLFPEDINARPIDNAERAVTVTPYSVEGYVLPYFEITGKIKPFYRVRLFESDAKYRQPKDSPNHLYFPKLFMQTLKDKDYVIITEGEKKAAAACKNGFPTVGLGGVDSWRNRTILISAEAALAQHKSKLAVRIPSDGEVIEDYTSPLAVGMVELIDLIIERKLKVIIVYDTDNSLKTVNSEVQRAAATLGFELRFRGVPFTHVRQLVLPAIIDFKFTGEKVGLDDFLVARGPEFLEELIRINLEKRSAFPRHPNIRDYLNRRLQKSNLNRKEIQAISLAVLSDMDSRGMRLRGLTGETYYFDQNTKTLLKASAWASATRGEFDSPFVQFMYREYGLSGADSRLNMWLGTQFTGEDPIDKVTPWRVFARPDISEDRIFYQLSDDQYATVDAEGLKVFDNGAGSILFEAEQVEPIDGERLQTEFSKQATLPLSCWWASTLSQVRLRDKDKQRVVCALLYYMSPWLFRWRGMQLPIELIIGESGSGKSTLCELRLDILTGRPILRNSPSDLKDWHASITNSGGIHVTDNVKFSDHTLRQKLSDEICRIVTEPDPFIEQRKYYTNADLIRIPVRVVFALTAIQQPFQNADLIQRSFILELDKSLDANDTGLIRYDSKWEAHQLSNRGGREAWLAHHFLVIQRFFQLAQQEWNPEYQAKHRLINFEQAILLMAKVFGIQADWIPDYLVNTTELQISESDWVLEGLHLFAMEHNTPEIRGKGMRFFATTISVWAENEPEFKKCDMLTSGRKLGRFLKAHKSTIFTLTGLRDYGKYANRTAYKFDHAPLQKK